MSEKKKALILLSGGIDSTVALYWALEKGYDCSGLAFQYKNQPEAEQDAIKAVCETKRLNLYILNHPEITSKNKPFKTFKPDNFLYYSLASTFAKENGFNYIIGGQIRDDWVHKDAKPTFYENLNKFLHDDYPTIIQPMLNLDKEKVVREGLRMGAPLELTWSCEKNGKIPCSDCDQCKDRKKISKKLKIKL
ncbi:MAG: 7-cyano-7-deazaguanine synthase [Nanoarchaeota archaeon]|nr:7-cyano-7-deazaguanine synthase [Nanoarchaeota archaeon]